jgi:hypothetical protein
LYRFNDGNILVNRRDAGAPTHKLYHCGYAGFPGTREHIYSAEGLMQNALRESSEEVLLITIEKNHEGKPWLIVPNDSVPYVLESARKLGMDHLPLRHIDVETAEPTDWLVVRDENGKLIFRTKAYMEFIYDSETSLNALYRREVPLSSEEILPVDAEGMPKNGTWFHFNRESYFFDPRELIGVTFGTPIDDPLVYKTDFVMVGGERVPIPRLQIDADYQKPYLGPEKIPVTHPHLFAPEDQFRRHLDALGVVGCAGRWIHHELWNTICKKADQEAGRTLGISLLSREVLAE